MKNILKKSIFLIILVTLIVSCNEIGEDAVFSTSASERTTAAVNEFNDKLTASAEGWVFEYYPDNTQQYGGYNYVVSFNENKDVDVYSELVSDFSTPETSSFNVIAVGGPVLTFDTYNSLMHQFSTPTQDLYQALGGDYEFLLSSSSEVDVIKAKGRVSGNNLKLIKLNETAQSYLAKVKDVNQFLSGASIFKNGVFVPTFQRNFTFNEDGEDLKIAYIVTGKGIKLYESVFLDGNEVSEFVLDKVTKQLISIDGKVILDIVSPPLNMEQDWVITPSVLDASELFFKTYKEASDNVFASWNLTLSESIDFGNTTISTSTEPGIMFLVGGLYNAQYKLTFSGVLGELDQMNVSKLDRGVNWSFFSQLDPLLDFIVDNAPYSVEASPTTDPTEVKLTSSVDPNVWFIIRK